MLYKSQGQKGQEQKKAQYNYKSEKGHSVRVKDRGMRIISNTRHELKTRQSKSQKSQRSMLIASAQCIKKDNVPEKRLHFISHQSPSQSKVYRHVQLLCRWQKKKHDQIQTKKPSSITIKKRDISDRRENREKCVIINSVQHKTIISFI